MNEFNFELFGFCLDFEDKTFSFQLFTIHRNKFRSLFFIQFHGWSVEAFDIFFLNLHDI